MKLDVLLDRFAETPALLRLASKIKSERFLELGAVVQSARPAMAAFLAREAVSGLVVVTAHPHRAEFLVQELAPWLEAPVELFPPFESLPYEQASVDRDTLARRQAVVARVRRERIAVVTSVRALMQSVALPDAQLASRELATGEAIDVEDLLAFLVSAGYEAAPIVDEVGAFARRGGIIDVFPIGASHPLRVELLGPQVESLRVFDPVTQRSLERIDTASVASMSPADGGRAFRIVAELEALDTAGMGGSAQDRWLGVVRGLEIDDVGSRQFFAPYFNDQATLIDAALQRSGPLMTLLEDGMEVRAAADELSSQADELHRSLVLSRELPPGLRPPLVAPAELVRRMRRGYLVEFRAGGMAAEVEERIFAHPPSYSGRIRDFIHRLESPRISSDMDPEGGLDSGEAGLAGRVWPAGSSARIVDAGEEASSTALIITSFQHARLSELLRSHDLSVKVTDVLENVPGPGTITILKGSLAEGWIAPGLGFELYTDHEIFGWSKPRVTPVKRRAPRDTFFAELNPGDYVVHIEHGIGQLLGTERMSDAASGGGPGIEREYLIVQYAGSDRLYVPTDQLDRLTRYVGMGDVKPQLNRLGTQEWSRAKARAKQAAEDMAEELIALYAQREALGGHAFLADTPWQRELEESFPFEETPDQLRAIDEVKDDMERQRAMDRLVVADVGYGKTEVAVRAAFKAVMDGAQVAVLVPTTVLAVQHLETFRERLEAFPVRVEMLSRFRSAAEQRDILGGLAAGELDVVIGTHRLLGRDVRFKNLGLLVVDEEQRFGVRHKERLKQLRAAIDVLTLTATPIPRTLHMSLTGIRDVSIIQTPPEGRLPIRTYLQPYEDRLVREAVIRELERDGQVYMVHNRVAGIEAVAEKLRRLLPEARIVVGHGQMPEDQLERVMIAFAHHQADVLLCSTIIESGLDIPNVNTIVIDHAQALGLAQLYQLRGRVGRGVNQAYAYLLHPRDARISRDAMRRMEAVFEATELGAGFRIAMADLEIRGAGNLLGARQSGHVAAIGFDLYTNLLKDALERLRGQPPIERAQVTVDLPFDVLIPASYAPDERERLSLYRRVAAMVSPAELVPFREEMQDRFGPPPEAVENLFQQVEVKFLAERAHVTSIVLRGNLLTIKGQPRILYDRLALYKGYGMNARIEGNVLRIDAASLGPDWLQAIKDILTETASLRERQAPPSRQAVAEAAG